MLYRLSHKCMNRPFSKRSKACLMRAAPMIASSFSSTTKWDQALGPQPILPSLTSSIIRPTLSVTSSFTAAKTQLRARREGSHRKRLSTWKSSTSIPNASRRSSVEIRNKPNANFGSCRRMRLRRCVMRDLSRRWPKQLSSTITTLKLWGTRKTRPRSSGVCRTYWRHRRVSGLLSWFV